jgi:hypothetical protein
VALVLHRIHNYEKLLIRGTVSRFFRDKLTRVVGHRV